MDKAALLALLDDPDVRAKLREVVFGDPRAIAASVAADRRQSVRVAESERDGLVAPDPRSDGVRAAVARGEAVPAWIKWLPGEKAGTPP